MSNEVFNLDNFRITLDKKGATSYSKVSYPLRYGRFSEIRNKEHVFQFNLNGQLKFIRGLGKDWPDPSEWLKRTITGDWVYYSTGGYDGPYDCFGEYYLPCLTYPSNTFNMTDPFKDKAVRSAMDAWGRLYEDLVRLEKNLIGGRLKDFINHVIESSQARLERNPEKLHRIIGDNVTVLPPDARHVDYDVVPLIIADGCLYRCGFCRVKSRFDFKERAREDIERQVRDLKEFFGPDISNYNSLFLGQHDALNSSIDLIEFAAGYAFDSFDLKGANIEGANLFLFGSVDSIINAGHEVFDRINRLPFKTYINVGLESCNQETLDQLGKGITSDSVEKAFAKIIQINGRYEKIEITSNFVFGDDLPEGHIKSFFKLMEKSFSRRVHKGTVYFSPIINNGNGEWKRRVKREFLRLKVRIPAPSYLYMIQRL